MLAECVGSCLGFEIDWDSYASRTSAEPLLEVTARLPCLATVAPAAAATRAAAVEMLKVPLALSAGSAGVYQLCLFGGR